MACYHPLTAYQCANGDVVFQELKRHNTVRTLQLPCGQCVGCRLERSRQWATRCLHEAQMHDDNCFITLTYDDAHLPPSRSLQYRPFQLFLKRLRKHFSPSQLRFYMCGEYGDNFQRPHFHACIFGIDFSDKAYLRQTDSGSRLYRSPTLEALWPFGFSSIGDVNFESAAYVARYIMKKVNGDAQKAHYTFLDPDTGELISRHPEFTKMSLKPGIGSTWFDKWQSDVYPHDYVVVRGHKARPPRYYDRLLKTTEPELLETLKFTREKRGREQHLEQSPARLAARETVALAAISQFPRKL